LFIVSPNSKTLKLIFSFLALLVFNQCTKKVVPATEKDSSLNYLALGDSYTIGESVAESGRWPVQLVTQLKGKGLQINDAQIIAKTGWTTSELNMAIDKAAPTSDYDLVSLLIGVNNQYRGLSASSFKPEFEALLERAIGFAGGDKSKVFVVSIPDYGVTPFGQTRNPAKIAKELDEYNEIQKTICEARGIAFFDITPISRKAISDKTLVAEDGLHPSAKMYSEWVELMSQNIYELTNMK
jgi:acyl-CoA thioesterase I